MTALIEMPGHLHSVPFASNAWKIFFNSLVYLMPHCLSHMNHPFANLAYILYIAFLDLYPIVLSYVCTRTTSLRSLYPHFSFVHEVTNTTVLSTASLILAALLSEFWCLYVLERPYDLCPFGMKRKHVCQKPRSASQIFFFRMRFLPYYFVYVWKMAREYGEYFIYVCILCLEDFSLIIFVSYKRGTYLMDVLVHKKTSKLGQQGSHNQGSCGKNCCVCTLM